MAAHAASRTAQPPHHRLESLPDAAERVGVSVKTLRRRIASGELRAYRSGARLIRVNPDDVDALFQPMPNFMGQVG